MKNAPTVRALAPSIFLGWTLLAAPASAATVFVKTVSDAGPGSLRAALTFANARPNTTVAFAIPRSLLRQGVATIRLARELPIVRANGVRIDGTSQARFVGDTNLEGPEVVLDGSQIKVALNPERGPNGLVIESARCRISGLVVQNFVDYAVVLQGKKAFENRIAGCYIGTDATGKKAAGNGYGLSLRLGAHHNIIGGTSPSARNVISGNKALGIVLFGAGTDANRVEGCFIGLDSAGTGRLSNAANGVQISDGASKNIIGGPAEGARNVLSGNVWAAVQIIDASSRGNVVQGNFVGLDASGTRALGNEKAGVGIHGGVANIIGGTQAGEGNVISANYTGINITGGAKNNIVHGNLLGTDASGRTAIPNTTSGVWIREASSGNRIGGAQKGAGNVLSGNREAGIWIGQENTRDNVVQGNIMGLDATGTQALPNTLYGIGLYEGAQNTLIGGTREGESNVIAGNASHGIFIRNAATSANIVQNNFIGVSAGAGVYLPNGGHGVIILEGAHDNLIGGSEPSQANIIGFRERAIAVQGATTINNKTEGNILDPSIVGRWEVGQITTAFAQREWDMTPFVKAPGDYTIRFQYTAGADRLDIEWAELLENGKSIARDAHEGRTGFEHFQNEYLLSVPALVPNAKYILRANVKSPSGTDSLGEVLLRRASPKF